MKHFFKVHKIPGIAKSIPEQKINPNVDVVDNTFVQCEEVLLETFNK